MTTKRNKQPDEKDHKVLAIWAADCAEHVLYCFVEMHPQDDRPRKAIEAARAWARGDLPMTDARKAVFASHAAARAAKNVAAQAAARAAGHAAATAHVAGHARYAAEYAVKAVAAAKLSSDAIPLEKDWQNQRLPETLRHPDPATGA